MQNVTSNTFTFACGDRNICDQGVEFVRGVLILITLPGQTYAYPVWHIPAKTLRSIGLFSKKNLWVVKTHSLKISIHVDVTQAFKLTSQSLKLDRGKNAQGQPKRQMYSSKVKCEDNHFYT